MEGGERGLRLKRAKSPDLELNHFIAKVPPFPSFSLPFFLSFFHSHQFKFPIIEIKPLSVNLTPNSQFLRRSNPPVFALSLSLSEFIFLALQCPFASQLQHVNFYVKIRSLRYSRIAHILIKLYLLGIS